ncbi:nitrilase-related carbon-nitrogen hydrolase [Alicyclobacillus acidocaldarius]|uniref:nitrilase-related carbon-nitrogen hydrolase n=1 Tax=Alicyclobacillus acidocaldarius TaxID=405212 RepID=UPI0002F0CDC7|nr:nitrilase-related carbon-nitrogen hydrolase [Alicyclobacillus acidocaldarius]
MDVAWSAFRVAIAQFAPKLGDVSANLSRHLDYVNEAKRANAQVLVFPELGLTGYQTQDLTLEVARHVSHPDIQRLIQASRDLDVLFSFVEETDDCRFFVTAAYASGGRLVHRHRKLYLPTYGMFDERRYFAPGDRVRTFSAQGGQAGVLICEDAWHLSSPYLLAVQGASVIYVPASSPWRNTMAASDFGSHAFWRQLLQVYAQLCGCFFVFANRVGYEDGVHFYGGSGVMGPDGEWVAEGPASESAMVVADLDFRMVRRARYTTPLMRDERVRLVLAEMQEAVRRRSTDEAGD